MAMSQGNVEVAKAAHSAMQAHDLEALLELCCEDIEWRQDPRFVEPGTYRGHEGVLKLHESLYERFEDFAVTPERYLPAGDRVVVFLRISASGEGSGNALDSDVANVLTFRDGKIAVLEIYLDRSEAAEDAGLPEQGADPS
jgi:ketosteroid isomerase-like protein